MFEHHFQVGQTSGNYSISTVFGCFFAELGDIYFNVLKPAQCFTMFYHVLPCFTMFYHVLPTFTALQTIAIEYIARKSLTAVGEAVEIARGPWSLQRLGAKTGKFQRKSGWLFGT